MVEVQATAEGEPFLVSQLGQMMTLGQKGMKQLLDLQAQALEGLRPLLQGGAIYHCGPVVAGLDTQAYRFVAAGPTTSSPTKPGSIASTTSTVIVAPHSSITPGCASTRRRLVSPALIASVGRSRIIGIETTTFEAPTTIVKVNPVMAICEHGGAYLLGQMGHFTVRLAD